MKQIFADSFYWIASTHPADNWHQRVRAFTTTLKQVQIVTTDEVLVEVLTFFSIRGSQMRQQAVQLVRRATIDSKIQIVPQTRESFLTGVALYDARPDKEYSLTDCISMKTMHELEITEVLTHVSEALRRNRHFTQEGFVILFPN